MPPKRVQFSQKCSKSPKSSNSILVINYKGKIAQTSAEKEEQARVNHYLQSQGDGTRYITDLYLGAVNNEYDICSELLSNGEDPDIQDPHGYTPLYEASHNGFLSLCQLFCSHGADVNKANDEGGTPLNAAVKNEHLEVCEYLCEMGAAVNNVYHDHTPIMQAASHGNMKICQLLCNVGADLSNVDASGRTAHRIAAESGHLQVSLYLGNKGPSVDKAKNNSTLLYYAAKTGDFNVCQELITTGMEMNTAHVDHKETPAYIAAKMGHFDICKLLIEKGADFNLKGGQDHLTPLYFLCESGNTELIELILSKGVKDPNIDYTALVKASECGHIKICQLLCAFGDTVNTSVNDGTTSLSAAAKNGHLEVCQYLCEMGATVNTVDHDDEHTPLMAAANNGHLDVCKLLCQKGADTSFVNYLGQSALTAAAENGHLQVSLYLASQGEDIAKIKNTLLHRAAKAGDMEVCQLMIEAEADINMHHTEQKDTPILIAAKMGHSDICTQLMKHGADLNIGDRDNLTPFYFVCKGGNVELAKLMLSQETDLNICDSNGHTPLYFLCREGHYEMIDLLLTQGADVNSKDCLEVALEFYHTRVAELLLKKGCDINHSSHKDISTTPLMNAAKTCSVELVELLLKNSADPDKIDKNGLTALEYAIKSGNMKIIKLLAKVIKTIPENLLNILAQSNIIIVEQEIVDIVARITSKKEHGEKLLEMASLYGSVSLLDFLLNQSNQSWGETVVMVALKNVIISDNADACRIVSDYCKYDFLKDENNLKEIILARGKRKIIHIFGLQDEDIKKDDLTLTDNVAIQYESKNPQSNITRYIPKSQEFSYFDIMEKMIPLIEKSYGYDYSPRGLVTFKDLLDDLHVKPVHYKKEGKKEATCPEDCMQKQTCERIRNVVSLVKQILEKMSKQFSIFKNVQIVIVGSLKEQTKIGNVDEADILLTLDEKYRKYFTYDEHHQKLQIWKSELRTAGPGSKMNIPNELETFLFESGWRYYFDEKKYFISFMSSFYNIIQSGVLKLPPGLSLSTSFTPCNVCKNTENMNELFVRCFHKSTCEDHQKKSTNPKHIETCDCRDFTSPCLTFSKIGLVLHLEFKQEDGSFLNLDVDVNPGSIPYISKFDGNNESKRNRLERERVKLIDWKTEWDKSPEFSELCGGGWGFTPDDGLKRSVRLRYPQCLLFYREGDKNTSGTLAGNKKLVYVVLKILKKCTDADISSFKMKYAVDRSLNDRKYETQDIGPSLQRVLRYWTMRDTFNNIDQALAKIGIERISVTDKGLQFHRNTDMIRK